MRAVRAQRLFDATVAEAERCWYDAEGWPRWVDGLDSLVEVTSDWPQAGATVIWQSGPAGRGRVMERVIAYEPARGQALEVSDASIAGRQSVTFTAAKAGVEVALALEYVLRRRSIVSPVVDLLFIRRAMTASLESTLGRFGAALDAALAGPEP